MKRLPAQSVELGQGVFVLMGMEYHIIEAVFLTTVDFSLAVLL